MNRSRSLTAILAAALALSIALPADASWKVLGIVKVDKGLDRDEIRVKSGRGFKRIKLKADAADVEIKSLHVVYGNGERDELQVRRVLREGSETLPLDLKGRDRVIQKVILWYATPEREKRKAIITIYGYD
jgi:hypothetical protein